MFVLWFVYLYPVVIININGCSSDVNYSTDTCSFSIIFRFGGALIAYNNIRIQQAMGLIVDPYIHFDIVADFIVFK